MQEMQVWSLGQKDPPQKGLETYSIIIAWRIPWTEDPEGSQFIGLQRLRHDWINLAHMNTQKPVMRNSSLFKLLD